MTLACRQLLDAIERWRRQVPGVLVVALDGHGAAGKSTLAAELADAIDLSLLHTDDFYRDPEGDPLVIAAYYDWETLARIALAPLRSGTAVSFPRGPWVAPGSPGTPVHVEPCDLILLEGVSAGCAALRDLVDRRVLLDSDATTRRARLDAIWSSQEWDHAWLAAESAYLEAQPRAGFDLVLTAP